MAVYCRKDWKRWLDEEWENVSEKGKELFETRNSFVAWINLILGLREEYEEYKGINDGEDGDTQELAESLRGR
ncbi:TPA_asm: hypothetical protein vir519_00009 [Caudoviricetes sp. vir519]|nr:TPA_asm: hypothetical protein vir519_00009 [Caudoviricetes sp. vir519]